jgi:hypothetical protein
MCIKFRTAIVLYNFSCVGFSSFDLIVYKTILQISRNVLSSVFTQSLQQYESVCPKKFRIASFFNDFFVIANLNECGFEHRRPWLLSEIYIC